MKACGKLILFKSIWYSVLLSLSCALSAAESKYFPVIGLGQFHQELCAADYPGKKMVLSFYARESSYEYSGRIHVDISLEDIRVEKDDRFHDYDRRSCLGPIDFVTNANRMMRREGWRDIDNRPRQEKIGRVWRELCVSPTVIIRLASDFVDSCEKIKSFLEGRGGSCFCLTKKDPSPYFVMHALCTWICMQVGADYIPMDRGGVFAPQFIRGSVNNCVHMSDFYKEFIGVSVLPDEIQQSARRRAEIMYEINKVCNSGLFIVPGYLDRHFIKDRIYDYGLYMKFYNYLFWNGAYEQVALGVQSLKAQAESFFNSLGRNREFSDLQREGRVMIEKFIAQFDESKKTVAPRYVDLKTQSESYVEKPVVVKLVKSLKPDSSDDIMEPLLGDVSSDSDSYAGAGDSSDSDQTPLLAPQPVPPLPLPIDLSLDDTVDSVSISSESDGDENISDKAPLLPGVVNHEIDDEVVAY